MNTVTKYALSQLAGVSKQAITKAVREGRIPTTPDGRIDLDDEIIKRYISAKRDKTVAAAKKSARKPKTQAPRGNVSTRDFSPKKTETDNLGYSKLDNYGTYDLEDVKKKAQIRKLEIEAAIKEGMYIEKSRVEAFAGAIWSIDSSEWTQMSNKIASEIVGVVMASRDQSEAELRVIELIDKTVYASLKHEKAKLNRWLEEFMLPKLEG